MSRGQKHYIKCRCILPQFQKSDDPPLHQFPVFSVINDDDTVNIKFVQCPNCGIVHKVTDVLKSEVMPGRESLVTAQTIDDIASGLSGEIVGVLEANDCDLATWEAVKFIADNEKWGDFVVMTSEMIDGMRQGKYVKILSKTLCKVETFLREEVIV
jgi:hypothetical protein